MTRDESISGVLPAGMAAAPAARRMTPEEFEDFYQKHSSALWGYVRRMCGNSTAADDLFQKTFFNFLGAEVPADPAQRKAYLYRIATNVVFDHFRSEKPRGEWQPPPVPAGDRSAILRTDMERMFRRLNAQERALLWLAHVEGYDHREIASILNLKDSSVRVLLFRARKRLATVMRQHGMSPEART